MHSLLIMAHTFVYVWMKIDESYGTMRLNVGFMSRYMSLILSNLNRCLIIHLKLYDRRNEIFLMSVFKANIVDHISTDHMRNRCLTRQMICLVYFHWSSSHVTLAMHSQEKRCAIVVICIVECSHWKRWRTCHCRSTVSITTNNEYAYVRIEFTGILFIVGQHRSISIIKKISKK
jgi:hypothetical protein